MAGEAQIRRPPWPEPPWPEKPGSGAPMAGEARSEVGSLLHGRRWSSFVEAAVLGDKGRKVIRLRG